MLAQCGLFATASPVAVRFAAAHFEVRHFRRRELIGSTQAPFNGFGLVISGAVQAMDMTLDGKEVALLHIGENEVFGHLALLAERPLPLTWVAGQASTAVALMAADKAAQLAQFPEIVLQLARDASQQVCDLLGGQKIQSIHPVGARICAWLAHHSRQNHELQLPTHAELAWQLNTTRESITRMLQKLLTDGVLARDGDLWRVLRPDVLLAQSRGSER